MFGYPLRINYITIHFIDRHQYPIHFCVGLSKFSNVKIKALGKK